jgi:hypothetical protein
MKNDNDLEKWFYAHFQERVNALIGDPQMLRVWKKFGPEVFRRSAVLEGLDAFVKANGFGGSGCIEIGTCNGLTAVVLARYFKHVTTIDIAPNPVKHEILDFLNLSRRVKCINVKDNAEKAEVVRMFMDGETEGAFVDGDHARDTETDFALVERCGQVLFHEHWAPQPPVVALVDRLRACGTVATAGKWALWRAA